jgi:HlyB family type I secretion system ABC transporter
MEFRAGLATRALQARGGLMGTADAALENVAIFRFLPPSVRERIALRLKPVSYGFGDVIIREGEPGDAFYVLTSGRARVVKAGEGDEELPLNVLRAGDEFGEMALLQAGPRTATVRCSTDVTALRLDRRDFEELLGEFPEIREAMELRVRHRTLHTFLREFSELGQLPLPTLRALLEQLTPLTVSAGQTVIREGDPAGPMYIVESGRLRVFREDGGRQLNLAWLRAGDYFGERSTLLGTVRAASVATLTDCRLLGLAPEALARLLAEHPEFRRVIEERVSQYHADREARIPLDFTEELLPREVEAHDKVRLPEEERTDEERPARPLEEEEDEEEPFATKEGHFRKRRGRIHRFPFVYQIDEMDCGAASLGMVCRHFGRKVSLTRIRQLTHTSSDGTSLAAICHAATELGLAARGLKVSRGNLDRMPVPSIVHWEGNHWIVLIDVGRKKVRVADPAIGIRTLTRAEFEQKWSGYAALFDYTQAFEAAPEGVPSVAWALSFIAPFKGVLVKVLLLSVVAAFLQMLLPVFTQVVVDRVVVEKSFSTLNLIVGGMLVALAFMLLANVLGRYMLSFAAVQIDAGILDFLTRRMLALPMSYFNTRRTGDIQRRLAGARQVREFVVQNGIGGVLAVVQIVVALSIMMAYSAILAAVFLVVAPLYAGLMAFSTKVLRPLFAELEESYGRYASFQIDAIKGIETVKATSAEPTFRDAMLNQFLSVARRQFRANFIIMGYDTVIQAVGLLSTALFLWVGARMVISGGITIGGFVAFNALIAMAYAPIVKVLSLWDEWQMSSVLLNRLNDIFESEPEQGRDRSRLRPVPTLEGRIELRNVGFRYGGPDAPPILSGISLEIPPGRTTAVVGRSGCGKTTLIKCLAGLLEATEGKVLFDGVDMTTLNYRELRRKIGIVLQENYMFDATIVRNIAFGDPEPDLDRVVRAAQMANAHEFIERLPMGYETRIGESGLAISGGQRQRIAIARALYTDPPVLIFDEATSALDSESERAIQENMQRLLTGRTSIVIAHRLSTIRNAHSIIVLEKGQVAERGTHDELMSRRGLYFYLCSQQLGL